MRFHKENGLLVPTKRGLVANIFAAGRYKFEHFRKGEKIDEWDFENLCVTQGLQQMLNSTFAGTSQITSWYLAVFSNSYTPVATDTASSIVGNAGEFTGYSGGARPAFNPTAASGNSASISNSASQATFNFTGTATLYGAFLISGATPGSNSGTLFSASQFPTSKPVANTDSLTVTYTLNATSS